MKRHRNRFWKIAAILSWNIALSMVLLSGCGRTKSKIMEIEQKEDAAITLLASQNWIKDIDRQLFQKFEEETGIKVNVLLTPDNEYKTLVGTCMAGGNNSIDIFMFAAGSALSATGIQDIAVDLSDEPWVPGLEEWALEADSCDGKVIGFNTWGEDYEGILYNKTYFAEHNLEVPETWEEFLALCDEICELGSVPLYEGVDSTWRTRCWVDGLTPALYREKPDFVEYLNAGAQNKFADIDAFWKGMEQIRALFAEQKNGKAKYYISDGQDEAFKGSYPYLTERRAVMMFTYSAYASELEEYGSTDEWGMFPVPLLDNRVAIANGGGMAKFINKNSSYIEECKEFFRFLARKDNLEQYYAARTDLVTSAFKGVESVHMTDAAREMLERSEETPVDMFIKDVYYVDTNICQYIYGFSEGTCSVEEFIQNCDAYREKRFDAEK